MMVELNTQYGTLTINKNIITQIQQRGTDVVVYVGDGEVMCIDRTDNLEAVYSFRVNHSYSDLMLMLA